eukprot:m.121220 g.121220  ORF g.121220 m.121220 type:complete len:280 (-) comp21885_c0_seq7:249-1088(-)
MERSTAFRQANFKRKGDTIKERVRERCLQRLRKHRQEIEHARRIKPPDQPPPADAAQGGCGGGAGAAGAAHQEQSVIESILGDEWASLRANPNAYVASMASGGELLDGAGPAAGAMEQDDFETQEEWPTEGVDSVEFDEAAELDYLELVFSEIAKELQIEEQHMIAEYERDARACEDETRDCVKSDEFARSDGVVCPICTKNWLLQRLNAIFCSCGFRYDAGHGGVSLQTLKNCLELAADQHSGYERAPQPRHSPPFSEALSGHFHSPSTALSLQLTLS